jgi:hypothetical protein
MEAFEHIVKVYLEDQGYIVTSGVKFPVTISIKKKSGSIERQKHGYEIDIVAAKRWSLLLASVKSYFGSAGVRKQGFKKIADLSRRTHFKRYTVFNNVHVRRGILKSASKRYGYPLNRIRLALIAGKFHHPDEEAIRKHLGTIRTKAGPVEVISLEEIAKTLMDIAERKTYINDPVVVTMKVLHARGRLLIPQTNKLGESVATHRADLAGASK